MDESLKIQMDAACNKLREMIRNERQVVDHRDAWRRMALTSSIKRRASNIPYKGGITNAKN